MEAKLRQDRNGVRTAVDVDRRYKKVPSEMEEVKEIVGQFEVDAQLSTSSTNAIQNKAVTTALNNKVTKEAGKVLSTNDFTDTYKEKLDNTVSTANDFTDQYKTNVDNNTAARHTHNNKTVLDTITESKIEIWDLAGQSETYFASSYAESGVEVLRGNIEVKNNRVCFNFVGTKSMSANTTTTLFTLPSNLKPIETRDFICFGQTSNNDGYIGYGYLTSDGLLQVRFNTAITSYIRFSFVYDIY